MCELRILEGIRNAGKSQKIEKVWFKLILHLKEGFQNKVWGEEIYEKPSGSQSWRRAANAKRWTQKTRREPNRQRAQEKYRGCVDTQLSMQGRQLSEHMSSVTMKQMPYFISSMTWNVGGVPFALCLSFMLIRNLTSFLHSTCKCACWQSFPFPYLSVFWQQERREQSWGFIETGMSTNHVNVLYIFQ